MSMPGSYNQPAGEHKPVYTPSMDSDDESLPFAGLSLSDKSYRQFNFRKDGQSWRDSICSESPASESEIKSRAKRSRSTKQTVQYQWDRMSVPRKSAIKDLLHRTMSQDPDQCEWTIAAIDNDKPEHTKRTGEVLSFSVILERVTPRNRANSASDNRRKSFVGPEISFAGRRLSKSYTTNKPFNSHDKQHNSGRTSRTQAVVDDEYDDYDYPHGREPHSTKTKAKVVQDDPFGNPVFARNGKPITAEGTVPFDLGGLPPHLPPETPIGEKSHHQDGKKGDKNHKDSKKSSKLKLNEDEEIIDIDALVGAIDDDDDILAVEDFDDDQSPLEVEGGKHRGRKRNDSGFGEKTPKRSRSKNKARRSLSIHIPKHSPKSHPTQIYPAGGRSKYGRRGSYHGSAASGSITDGSVLEAEYEFYSSSSSSVEGYPGREWRSGYREHDGRYYRPSREHRRGPPSPVQGRYTDGYVRSDRPRTERFASDGAIMRYDPPVSARPLFVHSNSLERFTPSSSVPRALLSPTHDYPELLSAAEIQRAESAQRYMKSREDADRERELAQRERDVARRESMIAQRESIAISRGDGLRGDGLRTAGGTRYNYDPRSEKTERTRRRDSYAGGYHY